MDGLVVGIIGGVLLALSIGSTIAAGELSSDDLRHATNMCASNGGIHSIRPRSFYHQRLVTCVNGATFKGTSS